uniref:Putative secreted protein n=1 Tax=Ixodes ricinus TaxID=34613 RepID=A0A6B0UKN2_IXORI
MLADDLQVLLAYNLCYIVSSMIAFTMSLLLFFNARTAFARETFAWDMTSSMSLLSTPPSSTSSSSSDSSSIGWETAVCAGSPAAAPESGALNFSAAAIWACWLRSSILASPKTM